MFDSVQVLQIYLTMYEYSINLLSEPLSQNAESSQTIIPEERKVEDRKRN